MFTILNKPQETNLVKMYRIEFAKDYKSAVDNRLEISDTTIRAILGYEAPKRKKIFGIF